MIENLEDSGELESNYAEYVRSPTFSPRTALPTAHFDETGSLTADKIPFRRPFLRRHTVYSGRRTIIPNRIKGPVLLI